MILMSPQLISSINLVTDNFEYALLSANRPKSNRSITWTVILLGIAHLHQQLNNSYYIEKANKRIGIKSNAMW